MVHLYHPDLRPLAPVEEPCVLKEDAVLWRTNKEDSIIQEIYQRSDGTFGLRYQAWVNFEDAGGGAHHSWAEYFPHAAVFTDVVDRAQEIANEHAQDCGLVFGKWREVGP